MPLGIEIQRFGSQQPADGQRFAIERVLAGEGSEAEPLATRGCDELFAPGQFFELSDAQKLSSKSFERYESGVKLVDSEALEAITPSGGKWPTSCFTSTISGIYSRAGKRFQPDVLTFQTWALRGAIAARPLSQARRGKSALGAGSGAGQPGGVCGGECQRPAPGGPGYGRRPARPGRRA